MAYPDYPVSDKHSPHWTYTDKQLFNRDGHIVRPLEYVDAYNPNKKWTWFDFKAKHGFGGTVGVDYADKILWIPNGSILRDIYDMHIDPRYTVLTAGIPKPILAAGTVSTDDWFATLKRLFGRTAHPPGGWDASGKWDANLNPQPIITNPMATTPAITPPAGTPAWAINLFNSVAGLTTDVGGLKDLTNNAANNAKDAVDTSKTTQNLVTNNSGGNTQTYLVLGGLAIAAFFLLRK